jgi:6-pyruvoyltetrahydropterin/6-carboxytetrahydropterin synthase
VDIPLQEQIIHTMTKQAITRKGSFDSMHRVLNEQFKCRHVHGHTYLYELEFEFDSMEEIGYAIDFKEIKRVGCQWIDDILDHGAILNPKDVVLIQAALEVKSKLWLMSLNGPGEYCNPSAENLAKEIFLAMEILFAQYHHLRIKHIRLYETPNCFTDCTTESITNQERVNFLNARLNELTDYRVKAGVVEYDDRKIAPL